jgi:hypothetical protein
MRVSFISTSWGDFSGMTDGEKYRDLSADIWDKVLPKVKELTETN